MTGGVSLLQDKYLQKEHFAKNEVPLADFVKVSASSVLSRLPSSRLSPLKKPRPLIFSQIC